MISNLPRFAARVLSLAFLCSAASAYAAPSCPPRTPAADEPFLEKAPIIPAQYAAIMSASKTDLAIETDTKKSVCVRLGWIFELDGFWNSPDMRFVGFSISGYEYHGHILVDRRGEGKEIQTGAKPVFSPDGKHFAFAQVSDAGWGNFEGIGLWRTDKKGSSKVLSIENSEAAQPLPYGTDWRVDRWRGNNRVELSMIQEGDFAAGDDYAESIAKSPRKTYTIRRQGRGWKFAPDEGKKQPKP